MILKKNIAILVTIAAIFGGLPLPLSFDPAFATSEGEDTDDAGDGGGEDQPEPELEPEPDPVDDGPPVCIDVYPPPPGCGDESPPEPPVGPCVEDPTSQGCDPGPPICTPCPPGQICADVCEPINPIIPSPPPKPPGDNCLFDPSLLECEPLGGICPEGFNMNEDGQCYPYKPCPQGYTRVDDDETGACLPIDSNLYIYINILIVNEINEKIRQASTVPTTCIPQESTITLGPGSIAAKGVRVLAAFDPCVLSEGSAILNLPDSNNNLKLVAVDLEGGSTHKAVEIYLQKINTIADDQTFYNADFTRSMTGLSPITNKIDTIEDINSLVLLNGSPGQIRLVSDNSMAFNAILSPD